MGNRVVNSPALAEPVGFAHAVVAGPGRTVYLGGQTAQGRDGAIAGEGLVAQFDRAAANLCEALRAAGGASGDLVSLQVFVTDAGAYRAARAELGPVWRRHFGRHYPAMALLEVGALADPDAAVELMGVAVVGEA